MLNVLKVLLTSNTHFSAHKPGLAEAPAEALAPPAGAAGGEGAAGAEGEVSEPAVPPASAEFY